MEETNLIDMELEYVKFCVSAVTLNVAYICRHAKSCAIME